jgi:hypothetical protein
MSLLNDAKGTSEEFGHMAVIIESVANCLGIFGNKKRNKQLLLECSKRLFEIDKEINIKQSKKYSCDGFEKIKV